MANNKKRYKTDLPTRAWAISRLRVDIAERLKTVSKARGEPVNAIVNRLLDQGLKQLEAMERRKNEGEGNE